MNSAWSKPTRFTCRSPADSQACNAVKIAILGAECTGKTTLAHALATALDGCGGRAAWVSETLRDWCRQNGRTPEAHEQRAIALAQAARIDTAAAVAWLLVDTTPLMTAVYSDLLFQDISLYPFALAHHACFDLTLLTNLDLPWVPDGLQRDGMQAQRAFDTRLREVLHQNALPFSDVSGQGPARTAAVLALIQGNSVPEDSY
ncbi:MAG: ATPase [Betaproteobacteria bacterium]|nr:ATPase [Betaproteobacteria bacterium]